jgi:ribonuclease R
MKPGDLAEFTAGLHGLDPPRNLGIYLDRWRKKGVPWVRVLTLDGPKEMKAEHLRARLFKARYEGDLRDEAAMAARLRQLVALHGGGQLAEEAEDDLARLEEALWQATCDAGRDDWSEEEVCRAHYGDATPVHLRNVRAALDRCRRAGTGRFQTTGGRGDRWRPWTRAEAEAMRAAWADLAALRGRMVQVLETEEGRAFQRVPLEEAGLTERDRATLAWAERSMRQFVEHDGVPDGGEPVAGIGGLGAVQVFGMDLHRNLGFLAADWIPGEHTTTSSDYVQFLLATGLWSAQDAVDALIRRHVNQEEFFEHTPDARAEADAAAFPEPRLADDPGRTDLRHLPCWTIDPPDARDFDDAVGIEAAPGGTRLWVHVADVSHYVALDSYLDRHARRRATSVYVPGRVLPMLPARLSDHLCSLRSDGDRFALSVGLDVAADGSVTAATFHKAVIRVRENLSYATALERARAGQEPFAALMGLAARMRSRRKGLELETGELKVLLEGSTFSALEKRADDATRMIETFMVAANEAVASHLAAEGVPQLFRCHPLPEPAKVERFTHQMEAMGLPVAIELPRRQGDRPAAQADRLLDLLKQGKGKLNLFGGGVDLPEPEAAPAEAPPALPGYLQLTPEEREAWTEPFRRVVDLIAEDAEAGRAEVATLKLLGCMGRAHYTPDNEGHFGLASTHYAHFTSPIRRYPDLVVHRSLKWLLAGRPGTPPHTQESLRALCDHCSNQERAADQLERRVKASALVLASLQGGAEGTARVTGITPASLFVLRDDGIEARIPARDLPGGPYEVDEWESMLLVEPRSALDRFGEAEALRMARRIAQTGEERRVRVRLADAVRVRLAGRDVAAGRTGAVLLSWP